MVLLGSNEERALVPKERALLPEVSAYLTQSWPVEYEMEAEGLLGDRSPRLRAREIAVTISGSQT